MWTLAVLAAIGCGTNEPTDVSEVPTPTDVAPPPMSTGTAPAETDTWRPTDTAPPTTPPTDSATDPPTAPPTDTGEAPPPDVDADGFAEDLDCNDADPLIHPAAVEVCDDADVDENCNGVADGADPTVDPSTFIPWYVDGDGDGFGVEERADCRDAGEGADEGGDCNDASASVSPGVKEICDDANTDEDCDGKIDDLDDTTLASSRTPWYADVDDDGFGIGTAFMACDSVTRVGNDDDCDDANANIYPLAPELCDGLGLDEDCDDLVDTDDPDLDPADLIEAIVDGDGDGFGGTDTVFGCLIGPPPGDCDDAEPAVYPGAADVPCNGLDDACTGWDSDVQVPLDVPTIGEAVASLTADGLFVCVDAGLYNEPGPILVDREGTTVASMLGSASTELWALDGTQPLWIVSASNTTVEGFSLAGSRPADGAAFRVIDAANVTVSDVAGNDLGNALATGGALSASFATDLLVVNSTFRDGEAWQGAGAYVTGSSGVTFRNVTFAANVAVGIAGGLICHGCDGLVLDEVAFEGNHAGAVGALWVTQSAPFAATGVKSAANSADSASGSWWFESVNDALVVDATFDDDLGDEAGAVVWLASEDVEIQRTTFVGCEGNTAGALLTSGLTGLSLSESSFTDCRSAGFYGAMATLGDGDVALDQVVFEGNAGVYGGGLSAVDVNGLALDQATFTGNNAVDGGGLYADDVVGLSDLNSLFDGNEAESEGGAIRVEDSTGAEWTGTTVVGNTADVGGGMACVESDGWVEVGATVEGNLPDQRTCSSCDSGCVAE